MKKAFALERLIHIIELYVNLTDCIRGLGRLELVGGGEFSQLTIGTIVPPLTSLTDLLIIICAVMAWFNCLLAESGIHSQSLAINRKYARGLSKNE